MSDQSINPFQRMWSEGSRAESIAWILLIALLPSISEELFYRGFIQRGLLLKWGPLASIATSSLLFAIVHGDPVLAAGILPLGAWLGVVAWRTGSVHLPIAMHAGVNGLWTAAMMISHRDPGAASWLTPAAIALLTIGTVAFVWGVVILRRAPITTSSNRGARLLPRLVLTCVLAAIVLALVIPPGAPQSASTSLSGGLTIHSAPTLAQIEAGATRQVPLVSAGDAGSAMFPISPGESVRLLLPPNASGVEQVIVSLDTGGRIVWLAYSGELSGKGGKDRPRGLIEQLSSSSATVLCLAFEEQNAGLTLLATLEEEPHRVAAASQRADEEGWAKRGRK